MGFLCETEFGVVKQCTTTSLRGTKQCLHMQIKKGIFVWNAYRKIIYLIDCPK